MRPCFANRGPVPRRSTVFWHFSVRITDATLRISSLLIPRPTEICLAFSLSSSATEDLTSTTLCLVFPSHRAANGSRHQCLKCLKIRHLEHRSEAVMCLAIITFTSHFMPRLYTTAGWEGAANMTAQYAWRHNYCAAPLASKDCTGKQLFVNSNLRLDRKFKSRRKATADSKGCASSPERQARSYRIRGSRPGTPTHRSACRRGRCAPAR